ncbi:protein of unknown function [Pararobbsia alpina]
MTGGIVSSGAPFDKFSAGSMKSRVPLEMPFRVQDTYPCRPARA